MSGVAQLFLLRGIKISGSDLKETKSTQELKKLGAQIFIGHDAKNIHGSNLVIYSSAIGDDNPEIIEAKRLNTPLIRRAEALAMLMEGKTVITISGAHGKTTTTSLASYLLLEAGLSPTVAIGGILKNIETNAVQGGGDFFVAEADESDGSFLLYWPKYSIITNIDYEHLDYYHNFGNIIDTFKKFIARTQKDGCIIASNDDAVLREILKKNISSKRILFGLDEHADIYPRGVKISGLTVDFECFYKNKFIETFHLALGGIHNVSNALSVIALGLELGIKTGTIKKALANYKGVGRRLEVKFQNQDYMILDDYAHHPTEIRATLAAIKSLNPKRLIAVFQPHRFSRTKFLLEEFSRSFDLADYIIITDIYPAGELPIDEVSAKNIYEKMKAYSPDKETSFLPKDQISKHIINSKRPGDLIVTLGAGDITKVCDELVEGIKR